MFTFKRRYEYDNYIELSSLDKIKGIFLDKNKKEN
jgi:hypothetical protein